VNVGDANRVGLNYPDVIADIEVGHTLLIDDGALRFRVTHRNRDDLTCRCEVGGTLRNHKGVNLPDSDLRLPSLTPKDVEDVRWAVESGVDYLALSFVRCADDVRALRQLVRENHGRCHLISKIETPQAVRNLDAIIDASDAVLVARGDLGVEMDVAHVPRVQKTVIRACRRAGKPVIVATQMLQSMIEAPAPTRAEVSDVANAIVDGTDAVMLSGETAVGKYPIEAVAMMARIAADTEAYDRTSASPTPSRTPSRRHCGSRGHHERHRRPSGAQGRGVWTEEGVLARLVSRYRLDTPVVALTPAEHVRRRLALYFGVTACRVDRPADRPNA